MGQAHTKEEHKIAFEAYKVTRNYKKSEEAAGATYGTIYKWAGPDFICGFGCPYHNWSQLLLDEEKAMRVKTELVNQGIHDPVSHEFAMRKHLETENIVGRKQNAIMQITFSDIERIAHWELIYAKLFYDLTGISLDYNTIRGVESVDKKEILEKGLHATNFEKALASLAAVQAEIDKLKHATMAETRLSNPLITIDALKPSRDELRKIRAQLVDAPQLKVEDVVTKTETSAITEPSKSENG